MFDLGGYLARIGLGGEPSLSEVHRAHCTSIPFENLDPHRGLPVSLRPEDLQRKLIDERRGGYCFEQNLLLKAAYEALGAEVDLLLARVRLPLPSGGIRPRSHLVLRVRRGAELLHADVGFGSGTPIEPLPLGDPAGTEHEQRGWLFRFVRDGPELVLQAIEDDEWIDLYGFHEQAVPQIDVETINWWTSTHPRSPFVSGVILARHDDDGRRVTLRDADGLKLRELTPGSAASRPVTRAEVPELLATHFGLPGFVLEDDRIIPAAGARG